MPVSAVKRFFTLFLDLNGQFPAIHGNVRTDLISRLGGQLLGIGGVEHGVVQKKLLIVPCPAAVERRGAAAGCQGNDEQRGACQIFCGLYWNPSFLQFFICRSFSRLGHKLDGLLAGEVLHGEHQYRHRCQFLPDLLLQLGIPAGAVLLPQCPAVR